MTHYADISALTTGNGTAETESTAVAISIPGPARIKKIKVYNKLGTGAVEWVRVDAAGIKPPQRYLMGETNALEGTEVGSGKIYSPGIDVDIPVPANVSSVNFYVAFNVASQTFIIGVEWEGP